MNSPEVQSIDPVSDLQHLPVNTSIGCFSLTPPHAALSEIWRPLERGGQHVPIVTMATDHTASDNDGSARRRAAITMDGWESWYEPFGSFHFAEKRCVYFSCRSCWTVRSCSQKSRVTESTMSICSSLFTSRTSSGSSRSSSTSTSFESCLTTQYVVRL